MRPRPPRFARAAGGVSTLGPRPWSCFETESMDNHRDLTYFLTYDDDNL